MGTNIKPVIDVRINSETNYEKFSKLILLSRSSIPTASEISATFC